MLRISTKLQQHSFHRGTALSALDDNSIQYGIRKLRTSVNRWEIKFLLDDNQKQSGVRKLLGNCSRIKFTREGEREGGNSKAKELELCNRNNTVARTQFQDFSCALPLPFHEKIARLVTRFPGTRLQRFRAYFIARFSIRTYLFHSDGVTRNRAGTRCR